MNNIYLVGFMGTGKTTVGQTLAKKMNRNFIDLDDVIKEHEQCDIKDIFALKGEAYFRSVEKKILKELPACPEFVIACGGGIVIDPENISVMKATGVLICLTASADVILKRTSGSKHRPLLNVPDPKRKIEELLQQRAAFYANADYSIDTSALSIAQVVDKLLAFITRDSSDSSC